MAQLCRGVHDLEPRLAREGLGLLVKHDEAGLATGPSSRDELECFGITQEVVAHIPHGPEINAVAPPGHEHARMCTLKRVKVRQVEEVSYVRDAVQQAARLGLRPAGVHDHSSRGDVDAWARRSDRGGGGGAAVSATAVSSHTCMPQVCTCPWPCGIVQCANAGLVFVLTPTPGASRFHAHLVLCDAAFADIPCRDAGSAETTPFVLHAPEAEHLAGA